MSRRLLWGVGWLLAALASGCVERTYTVLTNPPGAMVIENNTEVGPTPVIKPFQYYGTYRFRIMASGYETLLVDQPIAAPWYEYPGLDFIVENLIPWTVRDHREFRYDLQPIQVVPPEIVRDAAQHLRGEGKMIGDPLPPGLGPPPPACPPTAAPGQPVVPQAPTVAAPVQPTAPVSPIAPPAWQAPQSQLPPAR
jgi:hypothetical protein